jgi:hypothetical protein
MTIRRKILLVELLQAMIREWGREAVLHAFDGLVEGAIGRESETLESSYRSDQKHRRSKKPSAVQLVGKTNQPEGRREFLMVIAAKYDEKRFLPTLGDVREFLAMTGDRKRPIKDRSEGFRLLLDSTKDLPLEQLEHLAASSVFSGPAQLGPLSDAIAASGEARRQQQRSSSEKLDHSEQDPDSVTNDPAKPES